MLSIHYTAKPPDANRCFNCITDQGGGNSDQWDVFLAFCPPSQLPGQALKWHSHGAQHREYRNGHCIQGVRRAYASGSWSAEGKPEMSDTHADHVKRGAVDHPIAKHAWMLAFEKATWPQKGHFRRRCVYKI